MDWIQGLLVMGGVQTLTIAFGAGIIVQVVRNNTKMLKEHTEYEQRENRDRDERIVDHGNRLTALETRRQ